MSELAVTSPLLHGVINTLEGWASVLLGQLETFTSPPPEYIPQCYVELSVQVRDRLFDVSCATIMCVSRVFVCPSCKCFSVFVILRLSALLCFCVDVPVCVFYCVSEGLCV